MDAAAVGAPGATASTNATSRWSPMPASATGPTVEPETVGWWPRSSGDWVSFFPAQPLDVPVDLRVDLPVASAGQRWATSYGEDAGARRRAREFPTAPVQTLS